MPTQPEFDFSPAYRANGWGAGIAWRVTEYEKVWEEYGEDAQFNMERVVAHMIGDDQNFTFDIEDLTPIDEDDYCPECGQIGCTANKG